MSGIGLTSGGLGMGVAFVLEDYFTDTAQTIQRSMNTLEYDTERVSRSIRNSVAMIGGGIAAMGAGIASLSLFSKAADVRAEFQAYETRFETLLQSAERASSFMAKIKQDAKDNPIFGTESLVAANAALVATGNVAEEQSRRITNNLAEIIAGAGGGDDELSRMAVNLQQIGNLGKASSVDIKQFGMAGIPIYKLLADYTGRTQAQLQETEISLALLDEAFAHATSSAGMFSGATDRARESTKGLKAAMQDNIELTLESIGKAIEPVTRRLYERVIAITDKIADFVNSPVGAKVAQWVFYLSGAAVALGAMALLAGVARISIIKLTGAFAENTKNAILQTIATRGLTAGFRQMAVAAWASLGPYVLIALAVAGLIAIYYKAADALRNGSEETAQYGLAILALGGPIGWLIGSIAGIARGFDELEKPMDKMATTGVLGFFTRVAAVIEGAKQALWSWNGETYTMTAELEDRLRALGILDFVLTLNKAIVRIKQYWMGVVEGMKPMLDRFEEFKSNIGDKLMAVFARLRDMAVRVFNIIDANFKPLADLLRRVYDYFFGSEESLDNWYNIGKIVGGFVAGAFDLLLTSIENIVGVIMLGIDVLATIIETIVMLGSVLGNFLYNAYNTLVILWDAIVTFFSNLPTIMRNVGLAIVNSIKSGIQEAWTGLVEWVLSAVTTLAEKITGAVSKAFNFIKTGGGLWGSDDDDATPSKPTGGNTTPIGTPRGGGVYNHFNTTKSPVFVNSSSGAASVGGGQPIILQTYLDSDIISERVMEKDELNKARRG